MITRTLPPEGARVEVICPVMWPWLRGTGTVTRSMRAVAAVKMDDGHEDVVLVLGDDWRRL